ncbi:MAG: murein biosynthesis integral membrane protein MurJ [Deltaproteobacteria bacterium]|nr:murein biosynthesis integral membrane protein MurJ [Deltaproteobacteria bacterium]
MSENKNVSRAAGIVGFFTLMSRILGLVRDMVLARYFGSGMAADAFFVAFRIPNLLRRLFAEGSLTIAFIPVFTEYLRRKTKDDAFQLARVVITLLSLTLVIVTLSGIILSPWIVRIQAFGFGSSGIKYDLTVLLTRVTFPYIFFISLVALFMGILNSLRHFAAPAAAPIFLNVGIIVSAVWISPHFSQPIVGVAIGVIIGGVIQLCLQLPWVLKKGISLMPLWMPHHPAVKRIGVLMLPAIFGSAIYQFNQFIGTLLASFLAEGSVSWLYYADRLVQFPLGVFAIAVSTAALPSLSKQAAEKELGDFRGTLEHALKLVFFITIPSAVGLIVLGKPVIQVFFERGAFDALSTEMTNRALFFYALMRVAVSAFYALQDTKTPVKIAAITLVTNLLLSILFMGPLKHGGLALALSMASSLQFCLLIHFLKKQVEMLDIRSIMGSAAKSFLAAVIMGSAIYGTYVLSWAKSRPVGLLSAVFHLMGLVLGGVIIYGILARVFGCRELGSVADMFSPFIKKIRQ